jgi:hypothetical protein
MFFAINYALFLLAVSSSVSSHSFQIPLEKSLQTKEWQWVDIKPSRDLVWHDCFAGFKLREIGCPSGLACAFRRSARCACHHQASRHRSEILQRPSIHQPRRTWRFWNLVVEAIRKGVSKIAGASHDIIGFDPRGSK